MLQIVDQTVPDINRFALKFNGLIQIDDGDRKIGYSAVRVPVGDQVNAAIQQRNQQQTENGHDDLPVFDGIQGFRLQVAALAGEKLPASLKAKAGFNAAIAEGAPDSPACACRQARHRSLEPAQTIDAFFPPRYEASIFFHQAYFLYRKMTK